MFQIFTKLVVLSSLFLLTSIMGVQLQASAQETISPQKRMLIKELLVVTESDKNADDILNVMLAQTEAELPNILANILDNDPSLSKLSQTELAELKKKINASAQRFSKRYRELLPQRVNFASIVEKISYPLYDKYLTESELKDLIAFYKTPTGKKSISIMPQLIAESMQRSSKLLTPKVLEVMNEILAEELPKLKTGN
jgi:uncharacterized protein